METPCRTPLQDLSLEQFFTPGVVTVTKVPRKHKRPSSPSQTTPLNPVKRRVLDAEGIPPFNIAAMSSRLHPVPFMLSNVTPTKPSRLGNGYVQSYGRSQGTQSPLSSQRHYPEPPIESSTDPQSRHYPGFDIFRDSEHRQGSSGPRATLLSDGDALVDRPEEDKENVPLRRKAKKPSSKRRHLSSLDGSEPTSSAPTSKVVIHAERTPFSARRALR